LSSIKAVCEGAKKKQFKIETNFTTIEVVCTSTQEKDEWIECIQKACKDLILNDDNLEPTKVGLEDFDLLKVLGRGAYGKVIQARMKSTGDIYALKILTKDYLIERDEVDRTVNERNVLIKAQHPFLMKLHYAFQTNDKLYFVMDFAVGGELFFHLRKEGKFSEDRARFYASEVLLGLEYLHKNEIIYRDLKPENLLLDGSGHILVTDFGLAKYLNHEKTRSFVGTPEYVAPEVLLGELYDLAVDWWSLGVLIFEMIAGDPPFTSSNDGYQELFQAIKHDNVEFPKKGFSEEAKDLISKLLQKDPTQRLKTSEEVKKHPWFQPMDFEKLLRKEIEPPFSPNHVAIKNFSKTYLKMDVTEEMISTNTGDPENQSEKDPLFENFTFIRNNDNLK